MRGDELRVSWQGFPCLERRRAPFLFLLSLSCLPACLPPFTPWPSPSAVGAGTTWPGGPCPGGRRAGRSGSEEVREERRGRLSAQRACGARRERRGKGEGKGTRSSSTHPPPHTTCDGGLCCRGRRARGGRGAARAALSLSFAAPSEAGGASTKSLAFHAHRARSPVRATRAGVGACFAHRGLSLMRAAEGRGACVKGENEEREAKNTPAPSSSSLIFAVSALAS